MKFQLDIHTSLCDNVPDPSAALFDFILPTYLHGFKE